MRAPMDTTIINRHFTYFNEALNCGRCIDYFLSSAHVATSQFSVLDPNFNLSDHFPIAVKCVCATNTDVSDNSCDNVTEFTINQLRWDYGNLDLYKDLTAANLQNVICELDAIDLVADDLIACQEIERVYNLIGPAWKTNVSNIETCDGSIIAWQNDIKYLGVNIIASSGFACSLDNAKRNFYRAFNAVYGKVGGIAS